MESTARLAVTATLITQSAPAAATHTPAQTQVAWKWTAASGATSYKWGTSNVYSSAADIGNVITKTETGLTCNTGYTRYIWAYNSTSGCHSAVTTLTQTTSTCVVILAIGDSYGGGKVAYILQSGDSGYVSGETHGLIAATSDQSTGIQWAVTAYYKISVPAPGAIGTAIGTGLTNTNAIVTQNGAGSTYAAGLCDAYTNTDTGTGVYSDWYLPSKDELNQLFINRVAVGGFASDDYRSSSENDYRHAWYQYFNYGNQSSSPKENPLYVRAVRSF